MKNRTIAPPIIDAVDFHLELKPCQKHILDNGVEVYAIHAGSQEVMTVEWVFFAGNSYEEKNLVAAAANFLLKNGTTSRSAFQINEHFEYYGSYLNRACYNETSTLTLHCLSKHIAELLPAVQELITDSTLPEEELAVYKQNMKQKLSVNLKKSDFVAGRLMDTYLYGEEHPYGRFSRHKDFDALNREELVAFYEKYYKKGKCIIFTAGNLPDDLPRLLNQYFGSLPLSKPSFSEIPSISFAPSSKKGESIRITNDPGASQGAIRIGRPFPNRHHPDFQQVQVLNNLFGGFFGSRLMTNIREDKGYTYGIYSYLQNHIERSSWIISTEAGKEVCEATIKEVYHEMRRLRETPVKEEELLLVRNYMMGTLLGDLDGPFHLLARWKNIILNNLDENYFYNTIHVIKTVSPKELQALAEKYLRPDEFYELVVV